MPLFDRATGRYLHLDVAGVRFRVLAWDLPYHGKSLPPDGVAWWRQPYRLTLAFFLDFIARFRPGLCRAVIGIEAASRTESGSLDFLDHPRIGNDVKADLMLGLTGPAAPEARRREIGWGYAQGAPSVFRGDLHFYGEEHDLRGEASRIDTSRTSVYVLSGEYDWSATPAASRQLASEIPGAEFVFMPGLGHFPMAEDPDAFRGHLRPVLEKILAKE